MKTLIVLLVTLLLSSPLYAHPQENGLFYNPDRNGEGMNIYTRDGRVQFTLYTFIRRCHNKQFEDEFFIVDEDFDWCRKQQAWFFTGAHPLTDGEASGILFIGNPYDDIDFFDLARFLSVGVFFLTETDTGYILRVVCTEDALDKQADICGRTFDFNTYLYGPEHVHEHD